MISADRFLASKNLDENLWQEIRHNGISATEIAGASTPAGYKKVVENRVFGGTVEDNAYMRFGRDTEPLVAMFLKEQLDIMPNDWTICHGENRHHRATPDGLSLDHDLISEIKTTGRDFDGKIPIGYIRQMQWQMYVTDTDRCIFAWMLRVETDEGFVPGWLEPKWVPVGRDNDHIEQLKITADKLWKEVQHAGNNNG